MNKYEDLIQAVQNLHTDFEKFYEKGQAAAGTRLRKGLSELRKLAQDVRKDVQEVKAKRKSEKHQG
jgi:ABC-type Zn uptake system ZnuABC Zn-binding protein ZnuA